MNGVFDGSWRGSIALRWAYEPRTPNCRRDITVQPFQLWSLYRDPKSAAMTERPNTGRPSYPSGHQLT
jgi:hypothetical protein